MEPMVKMRLCDIDNCQAHAVGKCDFRYCCTKGCDACFCSDHKGSGTCMGRMEDSTCCACQPRLYRSMFRQIWVSLLILVVVLGLEFGLAFAFGVDNDNY